MAFTNTPGYPVSFLNGFAALTNSTGQTNTQIAAAGTNGSRITGLNVQSTDTSARDMVLGVYDGTTYHDQWIISIPATAGSVDTVPTVTPLSGQSQLPGIPLDPYGNHYIDLAPGNSLYCRMPVSITSTKQINVFAMGGNF
jgi:hypothetical protein